MMESEAADARGHWRRAGTLRERARRYAGCGQSGHVAAPLTAPGEAKYVPAWCDQPLCSVCHDHRTRGVRRHVEALTRAAVDQGDRLRFLTLTQQYDGTSYPDAIDHTWGAFKRLRQWRVWRHHMRGGVVGIEVEARHDGTLHPHLHGVTVGEFWPTSVRVCTKHGRWECSDAACAAPRTKKPGRCEHHGNWDCASLECVAARRPGLAWDKSSCVCQQAPNARHFRSIRGRRAQKAAMVKRWLDGAPCDACTGSGRVVDSLGRSRRCRAAACDGGVKRWRCVSCAWGDALGVEQAHADMRGAAGIAAELVKYITKGLKRCVDLVALADAMRGRRRWRAFGEWHGVKLEGPAPLDELRVVGQPVTMAYAAEHLGPDETVGFIAYGPPAAALAAPPWAKVSQAGPGTWLVQVDRGWCRDAWRAATAATARTLARASAPAREASA